MGNLSKKKNEKGVIFYLKFGYHFDNIINKKMCLNKRWRRGEKDSRKVGNKIRG